MYESVMVYLIVGEALLAVGLAVGVTTDQRQQLQYPMAVLVLASVLLVLLWPVITLIARRRYGG